LIKECKEALIDLRDQEIIAFGSSPEIPNNSCYTKIRQTIYEKLCEAQKFLPTGLRFCLYEGWRSLDLQKELFQKMLLNNRISFPFMTPEELFIETTKLVSPVVLLDGTTNIPPHATGAAIDVYLINANGNAIDMGLLIENWSLDVGARLSQTDSMHLSSEAEKNRSIMKSALEKAGFVNYPHEYWHWSYGDRYWAYRTHAPYAIYGAISS
jgi:D-alanyl-D-alanine dipeptidase